MNGTPRILNRTVLAVLGLVLLAAGAFSVAAGANTTLARTWNTTGASAWTWLQNTLRAGAIGNTGTSWWSVAALAVPVIAAILLLCWIVVQGGGRTTSIARHTEPDGTGTTSIDTSLAVDAVKDAMVGDAAVLATSVQSWRVKGADALRISVQARKGASPRDITASVQEAVAGLDELLGFELPVLIRVTAGTRTRFARTERVN